MKKTLIVITAATALTFITVPFVTPTSNRSNAQVTETASTWDLPTAVVESVTLPELTAPAESTAPVEKQVVTVPKTETVPEAPRVLSIMELGEKYLHLDGNRFNRACFDKVVAYTPDRFTEAVRESNIKALAVYGNVCVPANDLVLYIKPDGSFYDSGLAGHGRSLAN